MPAIDAKRLQGGRILKPAKLGLRIGDRIHCIITGGHEISEQDYYSIPVQLKPAIKDPTGSEVNEGQFPLNSTHLRMLANTINELNSDNWEGYGFDALVIPVNNPQTSQQVASWSIITETIKK